MTDVVNPKIASPDQLLPYHKKISAEGKALMICLISYTYMVLKIPPNFKNKVQREIRYDKTSHHNSVFLYGGLQK